MKILLSTFISLLFLPGALSENVRGGHTSKRKLGKADKKIRVQKIKVQKIKVPQPPLLPGVAPGDIPKVLIGSSSYFSNPSTTKGRRRLYPGKITKDQLIVDLYKELEEVCEIEVVISHRPSIEKINPSSSLYAGEYHALDNFITGYVSSPKWQGIFEESAPVTKRQNFALLTRIDDKTGKPMIDGNSNGYSYNVNVIGKAELEYFINPCTKNTFNNTKISPESLKDALASFVKDNIFKIHGLWIETFEYNLFCSSCKNKPTEGCAVCDELGRDYAFVQTGISSFYDYPLPMMISKMGSGLSKTVDPCIEKLYGREPYMAFCEYFVVNFIGANITDADKFCFDGGDGDDFYFDSPLNTPTNELDTSCSDGYCSCPPIAKP